MTALLYPDEASRLVPGKQLVIVRPGDVAKWDEAGRSDGFVAPPEWVALTGACPTCGGKRLIEIHPESVVAEMFYAEHPEHRPKVPFYLDCPDCRDGRRIVPLYTECWCATSDYKPPDSLHNNPTGTYHCDHGRVLVGRGSIEVVPVYGDDLEDEPPPHSHVFVNHGEAFLYLLNTVTDGVPDWYETQLSLDPLPTPGRDFGIVIDVTELA